MYNTKISQLEILYLTEMSKQYQVTVSDNTDK
jgi:hypothetical protein